MSLLDAILPRIGPAHARASQSLAAAARNDPSNQVGVSVFGQPRSLRDTRDMMDAYQTRAFVYACISRMAKAMKQAPLQMCHCTEGEHDEDHELITDHPLLSVMRRPNPLQRGGLFREEMITDLESTGNWYAEVSYDKRTGMPVELWRMAPHKVRIMVDPESGEIAAYAFIPGGASKPVVLEPHQVWHRKYANPFDDYRGLSPLAAARDAVIFDRESSAQVNAYFANGLAIGGVLSSADERAKESIGMVRRIIEARHKGARNAGKMLALPGTWTFTDTSGNPKDADWIEGKRQSREEICAVFNVPPNLAGDFTHSTFNNMAEAVADFWQSNMSEKYLALDEDLNEDLLPRFGDVGDLRCFHDLDQIEALQENANEREKRNTELFNGGILTLNEARTRVGEDDVPGGDVRRVPLGIQEQTLDELEAAEQANPAEEPGEPDPVVGDPVPDPPADPPTAPPADPPAPPPTKARRKPSRKAERELSVHEQARARLSSKIVAAATAEFSATMKAQRDALHAFLSSGGGTRAVDPLEPIARELLLLIDRFAWPTYEAEFSKTARSAHLLAIEAAYSQAQAIGLGVSYDISDPLIVKLLKMLAARPRGIKSLVPRVRDAVIAEIQNGLAHDASIDQIINGGTVTNPDTGEAVELPGIVGVYQPWVDQAWKAERVARTETGMAYNLSSLQTYESLGFDGVIVHDGSGLGDICDEINGETWTIAEARANPLAHPNCTRAWSPAPRPAGAA